KLATGFDRVLLCALDQVAMLLANFARLGNRVELNVRLVGVPPGVILVVLLGGIECLERFERGDDPPRKGAGGCQFLNLPLGGALLVVAGEEYRRTILSSHVGPLAVELRRIVGIKKDVEQSIIADLLRVIGDANRFGMPGVAFTDPAIMGRLGGATGVTA